MATQTTFETFKTRLRGELLQANDAGYEAARKVYNGMIDRYPRLIARCANVADVIAAVHCRPRQRHARRRARRRP